MNDKLESLRGQESSMGFMKQKQDIEDLELDLRIVINKATDSNSSTEGRGGIGGLTWACYGAEMSRGDILSALDTAPKIVEEEVTFEGGITIPSGCVNIVEKRESGKWKGHGMTSGGRGGV